MTEFQKGYSAGIQAAWEAVNAMVQSMPAEPRTLAVQTMRDTALDIGDNILMLKKSAIPGEEPSR